MATSPTYSQQYSSALSPPIPSISLPQPPKRRHTDMPTSAPSTKRRKASMMSTTSSSSHPLRQTSFPPEQPQSSKLGRYSRSPSVDTMSVLSGSAVGGASKKRKRKSQGRDTASVKREATAEEEDDGPDGGEEMAVQMVARTMEEKQKEQDQKNMLVRSLDLDQFARYEAWRVSKLADSVVRRIINQTLSQSAPASVILAVRTAAKIFAGEMVGGAVRVQKEWIAATGERQTNLPEEQHRRGDTERKETRRGPLLPDHLREAIRRYRAERDGGLAGQLNLYQVQASSGVERFGVKFNGKRLLR